MATSPLAPAPDPPPPAYAAEAQRQGRYELDNREHEGATEDAFTIERNAQFARRLPSLSGRVLDVGCANGRGGAHLKALRPQIVLCGLDCVTERVAALPEAYDERMHGTTTDLPFEDQSFDAIVAGEFLEHLYPHDIDATLCEFQRVLKVGGRLLMTTPHPTCFQNRFRGRTAYTFSHLTQHHPRRLSERLEMHGFARVKRRGSGKASRWSASGSRCSVCTAPI